ncbi:MAG: glycosyltransferase family 4 protein [Dictyoglomus sp.]|nr:glycosyltransferase family 4 protein [Dictyoglomus sp.]MDW8188406.1 glycosyltransferase family 4 protein [Dictyoglomus sp.]
MNILMLTWEFPPRIIGGLSRHVSDLSYALAEKNINITIITCCSEGAKEKENVKNLSIHRVPHKIIETPDFINWVYFLNFSMIIKGIELFKQNLFDIIHVHDWLSAFAGYVLKHSFKKPLVATIHATEYGRNQGIYTKEQSFIHSVEWWLTYEAWRVIVCSSFMKEEITNLFNLPEDKIDVIPNGVNIENLKTNLDLKDVRKNFALPSEKIVLYIGRMYYQKGPEYLLRSAPLVLSQYPNVKFIFVGTGDLLNPLKEEANNLGLQNKVVFTGFIDDSLRNALLNIADICVFPSIYEPFGIVALEAMALSKPVIASNIGGFKEIIDSGQDGLLFTPRDIYDLGQKILFLLKDENFANTIGKKAREKVESMYTWDKISEKTLKVYERVYKEYLSSNWM